MDVPVDQETRAAGWALVGTGLLTILLMSQHPSSASDIMTPLVHGGLQVVLLVQLAALLIVARRWGGGLLLTTGMLFFAAGAFAGLGAATINGFVSPSLASYPSGEIGHDIFALAWEANQALATLGVIATGLAFAMISVRLWQEAQRSLPVAGWLAGLLPAALLAVGHISMNLHGALLVYVTQAAWIIALGWHAARRGAQPVSAIPCGSQA